LASFLRLSSVVVAVSFRCIQTFLPLLPEVRLVQGWNEGPYGLRTKLGGSLLPCRGQEAPQSALDVDSHSASRPVNRQCDTGVKPR